MLEVSGLGPPFAPQNRDNMIAWMAAKCDFPEYGKMLFYQLPKEKLIYGPNQIEAMINQWLAAN